MFFISDNRKHHATNYDKYFEEGLRVEQTKCNNNTQDMDTTV